MDKPGIKGMNRIVCANGNKIDAVNCVSVWGGDSSKDSVAS